MYHSSLVTSAHHSSSANQHVFTLPRGSCGCRPLQQVNVLPRNPYLDCLARPHLVRTAQASHQRQRNSYPRAALTAGGTPATTTMKPHADAPMPESSRMHSDVSENALHTRRTRTHEPRCSRRRTVGFWKPVLWATRPPCWWRTWGFAGF